MSEFQPGSSFFIRFYKAPELLVDYNYYDYAIDMWGVGCILAQIVDIFNAGFLKGSFLPWDR